MDNNLNKNDQVFEKEKEISKIKIDNNEYYIKDSYLREAIDILLNNKK